MAEISESKISGRRLARNAVWNFGGMVAPLLVGLVAIPMLIDGMGKERFGLLAIIWMGVGYFSLFDMGLGRALTKLVAERLGDDRVKELRPLIWTALSLIGSMGVVGAVVVTIGAGPLIREVLNVDPQYQSEAIAAFRILGAGLPIVVLTTSMIGLLEAHQRFATITAIRIPLGVLTFVGPLITLQYSVSLIWATTALLLARLAAAVGYYYMASSMMTELKRPQWPDRIHMAPLFHFGGWLTITNIVGPLMVYLDRFLIGAVMSMTAVAYYVTPYEVVSRAQLLPQSIMGVLFPAMTAAMVNERTRMVNLYGQSALILLLLMLPVAAGFFLLAPESLEIWLGPDFRDASTPVLRWLALGLLVNAFAKLPLTLLQSIGRPDLVAKTHLIELIPYVLLLWSLTISFGITGAAAAWFLRILADTLIINEIARSHVPEVTPVILNIYGVIFISIAGFGAASLIEPPLWRIILLLLLIVYALVRGWSIVNILLVSRQ